MEQDEQCKFGVIIRNDEHKTPVVYGALRKQNMKVAKVT